MSYSSQEPEPPSSSSNALFYDDETRLAPSELTSQDRATVTAAPQPLFAPSILPPLSNSKASARCRAFRRRWYPNVSQTEWNDWRWQLKNRITTLREVDRIFTLTAKEYEAFGRRKGSVRMPVAITPYYASLMDEHDAAHPIRRCMIPVSDELKCADGEAADPLGEDGHSPVPGIVHRYPDRVLFLVTPTCSNYCRYCTRSRKVGAAHGGQLGEATWDRAIAYIESTPSIRDVLLSGGDPLTLSDENIDYLLSRLRRIPHVEILRIGTKVPAVLPMRITPQLVRILRKYHPLWMSIHATHPDEVTAEMAVACTRLADAGIPLGSQTVLLKGINDEPQTMRQLMHGLMKMRVRPYYIYQCDPILGSSHFRTSVDKGLDIIQSLRGHTSGYAVPTFVIDAPGGGGKVPITPDYYVGRDGTDVVLRNFQGKLYRYPDTAGEPVQCSMDGVIPSNDPEGAA
jgi:lysine 2,3-aminomutase